MKALADDSCVDPAVLGAFMDGTLPEERVADVTRHLSRCARCRQIVGNAIEVEREPVPATKARHRPRWSSWIAVAAVLVAVAVAVPLLRRDGEPRPPDRIARLVAASPTSARTIEPRISGGFAWAPLRAVRRTPATDKTPEELVASGAAGAVLREIGNDRTPRALHMAGVAYLVAGDAPAAVPLLAEASRASAGDARIWSDYAAALYAAASPDDLATLQRALDAANRAIHLNPSMVEPYFNRALALEHLGSPPQAAAAWNQYLQRDGASKWSAEARKRLADARARS